MRAHSPTTLQQVSHSTGLQSPAPKTVLKAAVASPLVVIPVVIGYSLIAWIAAYFQEPPSPHGLLYPDPRKPWEAGAPYTLYGLPTAYLCMIFVGIPAHYLASKMNLVRIWFALLTAAIATVLASWFYFSGKFHPGFTCFLFVNSSAIALVFYAIARPRSKKPKGSNL